MVLVLVHKYFRLHFQICGIIRIFIFEIKLRQRGIHLLLEQELLHLACLHIHFRDKDTMRQQHEMLIIERIMEDMTRVAKGEKTIQILQIHPTIV